MGTRMLTLVIVFFLMVPTVHAALAVKAAPEAQALSEKQQKKLERKKARLAQRFEKWQAQDEDELSILDNSKFRLGALLLAGAFGFGILSALGLLRALFGFISGLLAFAAIVFLVWGLVEFYA